MLETLPLHRVQRGNPRKHTVRIAAVAGILTFFAALEDSQRSWHMAAAASSYPPLSREELEEVDSLFCFSAFLCGRYGL